MIKHKKRKSKSWIIDLSHNKKSNLAGRRGGRWWSSSSSFHHHHHTWPTKALLIWIHLPKKMYKFQVAHKFWADNIYQEFSTRLSSDDWETDRQYHRAGQRIWKDLKSVEETGWAALKMELSDINPSTNKESNLKIHETPLATIQYPHSTQPLHTKTK